MKEYNFKEYKKSTIDKAVKKYGTLENAVFEMEAYVSSVKLENETLRDMVNWDCEKQEFYVKEKYPGELIDICDIILKIYQYGEDSYRNFDMHPDYTHEELDRAGLILSELITNLNKGEVNEI